MLDRHDRLTNDQIKAILMYSTDKMVGESVHAVGTGYLQVVRTMAMTLPFKPSRANTASPVLRRHDDGGHRYGTHRHRPGPVHPVG